MAQESSNTSKVLALSAGKVATSLIGIVSAMVLTRVLTVDSYATYRQTILVFSFSIPFLTLGLPQAIYFFLGEEKSRKRGMLNDNLFLLICMGLAYAIFIWLGGNHLWAERFNNPDLVDTLMIYAPFAIFSLPLATITAALVVQNKVVPLTIFNILSRIFLFIFVLASALIFMDVNYIIAAVIISSFIVFVSVIVLGYKYIPNDNPLLSTPSMGKMLKYSVPLGLSALVGTLSIQLDQVIVSSLCSKEQYAIYANGTMEIPVVGIITGSIATIILVDMRDKIAAGNINDALLLFRKAALKSTPILIPLMFFLLIMAQQFIEVVFSPKYSESATVFRIYLLKLPARIVYYSSALMAFGLTRVVLYRSLFSLLFHSVLAIILVYLFGYLGAIFSFIAVLYLWDVIYNFRILSKKFSCRWFELLPIKEIAKVFLISSIGAILILPGLFLEYNSLLMLLIASLVYFPITFLLLKKYNLVEFDFKRFLRLKA